MNFDLYQEVTDQILAALEKGVIPWRSPIMGQSKAGFPKNLESGKEYRGVNVFLLAMTAWSQGYGSSYWLTFNQAQQKGGNVRKGEKASMVLFWKQYDTKDRQTGEEIKVPVLRYFRVFNADQCEGLEVPDRTEFEPTEFNPIEAADSIVKGYADAPVIEHSGQRAYYLCGQDIVRLPEPTRFTSTPEYYATLFHELAHSTGNKKRLDRGLDTNPQPFGSPDYGREELIAEMAAAYLSAHAGIAPATLDNAARYIQGWIKTLKGDKRLIVSAAGAAQRAADWIRGQREAILPN